MSRRRHRDGSPCTCKPVGLCVFCAVGKHEKCTDPISILGCGCTCAQPDE